jgi:hypothetical protein
MIEFIKFLLASEPYLFVWIFILFFKWSGFLNDTYTSWKKLKIVFFISLTWIPFYFMGYRYESMLYGEVFTSIIIGWPYIKHYFRRSAVLLLVIPLLFTAWLAQATAVRFEEFIYPEAAGKFLLGWSENSPVAGIIGYSIWLGATMPIAELIWYPTSMLKILSEFCIIMYVLPDNVWEYPVKWLGRMWVFIYGIILVILIPMEIIFTFRNTRAAAMAALVIFTMMTLVYGYFSSPRARKFMSTKMYTLVSVVMFFQYTYWEFVHSAVLSQWKYLIKNSLGSLSPVFDKLRYPDIPGISQPWNLPFEELGGYLTVFPTILILIILLNRIKGLNLIKGEDSAKYFSEISSEEKT